MDDGLRRRRRVWHISTWAFLKEENRKSRLVARMLSKPFGPPFATGIIGGGGSASATAILRFVSPQRPHNQQQQRQQVRELSPATQEPCPPLLHVSSNGSRVEFLPILLPRKILRSRPPSRLPFILSFSLCAYKIVLLSKSLDPSTLLPTLSFRIKFYVFRFDAFFIRIYI